MISALTDQLKKRLSPARYEHSIEVASIASRLASHYGLDPQKAEIAGLLHDCAKEIPFPLLYAHAEKSGRMLDEIEMKNPKLLHALVGADIAFHEFGIKDHDILSAIAKHTTGSKAMSPLDQIVYVADYLDPLRELDNLALLQKLAYTNLDLAVSKIAGEMIQYLTDRERLIHPNTIECWNVHVEKKNL